MRTVAVLPTLERLRHEEDELSVLAGAVRLAADARGVTVGRPLRILEAGCGRRWQLDLGGIPIHLTGIDLDGDAVRLRVERHDDLDVAVVADLRTVDLPDASFDVVFSSFVLEHVAGAAELLDRFVSWLRPGGLLLLRLPDRDSVYGFVARHTPHRLHVAFRRHVIGMPAAGTAGHGPYPVVYDRVVSRRGMHAYARRNDLRILHEHGSAVYLERSGRYRPFVAATTRLVGAVSAGRLASDHNNLLYVLAKPGG